MDSCPSAFCVNISPPMAIFYYISISTVGARLLSEFFHFPLVLRNQIKRLNSQNSQSPRTLLPGQGDTGSLSLASIIVEKKFFPVLVLGDEKEDSQEFTSH